MKITDSDLELIDEFIIKCRQFIDPKLFRQIRERGLTSFIDRLPTDIQKAKIEARLRLRTVGYYTGDPVIEKIASKMVRLDVLRSRLESLPVSKLEQIQELAQAILDLSTDIINETT